MTYSEPVENRSKVVETFAIADNKDTIRWGPILGGLFVAIATQLILSALGAAIGLTVGASGTGAGAVGIGVGIWTVISFLISLFLGSWVAAAGAGPMNKKAAMLHGFILWATTLALSAWLLTSGVSGAFGMAASNAGEVLNQVQEPGGASIPNQVPNVSPDKLQQVAGNSAKAA